MRWGERGAPQDRKWYDTPDAQDGSHPERAPRATDFLRLPRGRPADGPACPDDRHSFDSRTTSRVAGPHSAPGARSPTAQRAATLHVSIATGQYNGAPRGLTA